MRDSWTPPAARGRYEYPLDRHDITHALWHGERCATVDARRIRSHPKLNRENRGFFSGAARFLPHMCHRVSTRARCRRCLRREIAINGVADRLHPRLAMIDRPTSAAHSPATALIRHYIRDLVYGANDGIITTFAVVAGVTGGSLSHMAV